MPPVAKRIWAKAEHARICFLSAFEIYESEVKTVFTNFKTTCFITKPVTAAALVKHIEAHLVPAIAILIQKANSFSCPSHGKCKHHL